jgi:hypothetical protein
MVFVNRTRSFPKGDELNFVISGGTPSVLFVYGQSHQVGANRGNQPSLGMNAN